jgi:hypothetical protein
VKGPDADVAHAVHSLGRPVFRVKRELKVGMTAGVFVMEDFILSGWMTQTELRHVNRIDVEPCGTKQCVLCSRA